MRVLALCTLQLLVVVALAIGVWEGRLAKSLLAGTIGRTAGGRVTIDTFAWTGWGEAEIRGVTLTAPDWDAPGAQVACVERVTLKFDPWSLAAGPLHVHELSISAVALTLVEDPSRGSIYNFQTLTPSAGRDRSKGGESSTIIDRASIEALTLSFERLGAAGAEPTGAYSGEFRLEPEEATPSRSRFLLRELHDGFRVDGWIDQGTLAFSFSADGLEVSRRLALALPRTLRPFAENSDATGRITRATLSRDIAGTLHGVCEFEGVRATLPNHLLGPWVRYEQGAIAPGRGFPRFEIAKGSIEVNGPRVDFNELDFTVESTSADGRVASLPVHASFTADLSAFQTLDRRWRDRDEWARAIADAVPFELRLGVPAFVLGKSKDTAAIELPLMAANFLRTFNVKEMEFDLAYAASRAAPTIGPDGSVLAKPITTSGTLVVTDGIGAFDGFPYPLENVSATVRFADEKIEIADLRGTARGGESVLIHGEVTDVTDGLGVDLTISAAAAPVDATLIECFSSGTREFLDSLFWTDGYLRLRDAGLIAGPEELRAAALELPRLELELEHLLASDAVPAADIASHAARIGKLVQMTRFGAFEPGGKASFTLRAKRAETKDAPVIMTGSIRIMGCDLLPTIFPYPVRVQDGEIRLLEDRVDFGDGISFTTLGGARGHFKGSLGIDQSLDDPRLEPNLQFALENDQVNPVMVMAVPPAPGAVPPSWPGGEYSEGGKLLSLLDIRGTVSLEGRITAARDGDLSVECEVTLHDGSVHPHLAEDDPLHRAGLLWPTGFGLDDCHASVVVTDERVTVASFAGLRGNGLIEASGFASLVDGARDLEVRLRHVDLSEYALHLVPYAERAAARELWERYSPSGYFDADLVMAAASDESAVRTRLAVRPKTLAVTMPRGPVSVQFDSGSLRLLEDTVTCEALSGVLRSAPGVEGRVCLDGSYGPGGVLDMVGDISHTAIESPAIHELLSTLGGPAATDRFDEFAPRGLLDSQFVYTRSAASDEPLSVDAWISELSLGDEEGRLDLCMTTPAHIHVNSKGIIIAPTHLSFIGGEADVAGWLGVDDGVGTGGSLEIDLLASMITPDFASALPSAARAGLRAAGFSCHDFIAAHATPTFTPSRQGLTASVDASITLRGGTLAAEPGVADLCANFALRAVDGDERTTLHLDAVDASLLLAGRAIHDAHIELGSAVDDDQALDARLSGTLGMGRVEILARASIDAPFTYRAEVALAGCDLASLTVDSDGVPADAPPAREADPGLVEARFGLGGDGTGIASRRGRGSALVRKADLARLPIALSLLQVTQLSLSFDPTVDRGLFDFTVDGPNLHFEQFNLRCRDLILDGSGWLDTQSGEVALRLRNRGTTPILSDILGGFANQLFQLDVRGTLQHPKASLAPLPGIVPAPTLSATPAAGAVR